MLRNTNWNDESKLGGPVNRDRIIRSLLLHFDALDLRDENLTPADGQGPVNVLGDSYEYLIRQFADDAGKKGGEFLYASISGPTDRRTVGADRGDAHLRPDRRLGRGC